MIPDKSYKPEFESLKDLLIDMAQERSVDVLLDLIVSRMCARPHVALTRIWLIRKGDICRECSMADNCRDRSRCLHLVAGAGLSQATPKHAWLDPKGYAKRIPLHYSCIGKTALTGKAPSKDEILKDPIWKNKHTWENGENILGFGAQPLVCKGDVSGVIAVYSWIDSHRVREGKFWLKMIANHTASTLANARAFSEIDRLKSQLELENAYLRQEIEHTQVFGDIIGKSPQLITIQNRLNWLHPPMPVCLSVANRVPVKNWLPGKYTNAVIDAANP